MKTMSAKYAGKCRTCGGRIEAGDTIRWSRAAGANHADCDGAAEVSYGGYCEDFPCCGHERGDCNGQLYGSDASIKARVYARGYDEMDAEGEMIRREEAEYLRGYHEVAQIQAISEAGSVWRDTLYREMEMAAYNRGEDY